MSRACCSRSLLADGATTVVEPAPTRDHTERMLAAAGADLRVDETTVAVRVPPAHRIEIRPADRLAAGEIEVPGDFSSAAFLIVAALVVPGSDVRIENVGLNPTHRPTRGLAPDGGGRRGGGRRERGELRGSVHARHGPLRATRVDALEVPLAIDELPLVALLGCFAEGRRWSRAPRSSVTRNRTGSPGSSTGFAGSAPRSRIARTASQSRAAGTQGGALDARDHRLAMLGAIAGLASRDGVEVDGMESAAVATPDSSRTWRR